MADGSTDVTKVQLGEPVGLLGLLTGVWTVEGNGIITKALPRMGGNS